MADTSRQDPKQLPFYYNVTSDKAQQLIANQPIGTYLIRPAASFLGGIAIDILVAEKKLKKRMIHPTELGWKKQNGTKEYTSIEELIKNELEECKVPLKPDLIKSVSNSASSSNIKLTEDNEHRSGRDLNSSRTHSKRASNSPTPPTSSTGTSKTVTIPKITTTCNDHSFAASEPELVPQPNYGYSPSALQSKSNQYEMTPADLRGSSDNSLKHKQKKKILKFHF